MGFWDRDYSFVGGSGVSYLIHGEKILFLTHFFVDEKEIETEGGERRD